MNAPRNCSITFTQQRVKGRFFGLATILILLVAVGCAPPRPKLDLPTSNVGIYEPLWTPLEINPRFVIGNIEIDIDPELERDRNPTTDEINQLKAYIHWQMNHTYLFEVVGRGTKGVRYEIRGKVTRFRRGNATERLVGLSISGRTYIVAALEIIDLQTGGIAFGGVFKSDLKHTDEKVEHVFDVVAENFSHELRKQHMRFVRERKEAES